MKPRHKRQMFKGSIGVPVLAQGKVALLSRLAAHS
jgi:hypothetical protein